MKSNKKIIRTATVASSLDILLKGQLGYLNQDYEIIAISGQDQHLKNVSIREQVQTIDVVMSRQIVPFQDLVSLYKLYKTFKNQKPLIVHSITPKAGLLSMIAAKLARVPIRIHTFTGLVFPTRKGFMQQFLIFLDQTLCYFATHIYPEGQGVKNDLIKYKITKKPLKIIANGNINGIDLDYFDPNLFSDNDKSVLKNKLKILDNDFVFVFVGRLVKDKGINELIQAFLELNSETPETKLLLVGDFENNLDPLEAETLKILKNHQSIISVGFQDDVRPYYSIANVLVFPSYREGFPNVVLQASAMGLPCMVTNINGCNEIIQDNFNGLIIEPKNQNEILMSMKRLITTPNLLKNLSENSRTLISQKFNQKLVWKAVLDEYKLLEKNLLFKG